MGKLKYIGNRIGAMPSRVAGLPENARERDRVRDHQAWRRWYKTARWQRLRWQILVRDRFTCALCGKVEPDTSQLVADHRVRHGGDEVRFWDPGGLQTLCKPCHDGAKQRADNAARRS